MMKYPRRVKMMIMTTKMETISLVLTLRPTRRIQCTRNTRGSSSVFEGALDLSVSSMDRHRDFCVSRFAEYRDMCLLLGEDGQVLRHKTKDRETKRDEHGGDHHFGPLRSVAGANRILHSGDGDIETIG